MRGCFTKQCELETGSSFVCTVHLTFALCTTLHLAIAMSGNQYAAHFVPLESSPEIFNFLIAGLGASSNLKFREVYTLDELDQLPHPALALILIFPTSTTYERHKAVEEATAQEKPHSDGEVVWFKQTINNACGLYAILHAICNSDGTQFIGKIRFTCYLITELKLSRAGVIPSKPDSC